MSGIDYKYTGKTNRFFNNGTIYSVVADNVGHQSTTDERTNEHDLSDDYLNKNFVMLYTQAMYDAGTLPLVGMECQTLTGKVTVKYIGMSVVVADDGDSEFTMSKKGALHSLKPIEPPIELVDGKAYQFDVKTTDSHSMVGIYDEFGQMFIMQDAKTHKTYCTNIQLLEVKS